MRSGNVVHLPERQKTAAQPWVRRSGAEQVAYAHDQLDTAIKQLEAVLSDMRIFEGLFSIHDPGKCSISKANLSGFAGHIHEGLVAASAAISEGLGYGPNEVRFRHVEATYAALDVVCLITGALRGGRVPDNVINTGPMPGAMRLAREKLTFALRAARRARRN
jgi:hypothetical protein